MKNSYTKPPGVLVGTVLFKHGVPDNLELGPGLLPSEIGAKSARKFEY